ncbi:MAG: SRPBCC domain-containing protein, partial [Burkholderiales bacterium]|nr:SRPBCC domain-containing protein [Burkholderiales bacterium]
EGIDYRMRGTYREIVESERLVFSFSWDEEGERGMETVVTVIFADEDGMTRLTFHQAPFQSVGERDGHRGGWSECFERLAAYLARPA